MRPDLRRVLGRVLGALMVLSLVWSGWSMWQFSRSGAGGWLVERSTEQMQAAYDRALAHSATPERLGALIGERLAESPRNWVALGGLMDLALEQGVPLPENVQTAYALAHAQDFGAYARAQSCLACAYDLRACGMGAELGCGIGVNLTVLGDLISLGRESGAWARGQEVDQLDVTLSFIGVGATGLVLVSGGSSLSVKAGAGMMKVAHRMGRLTPGVRRLYQRAFREGVDWARVPAIRNADDLASVARMDALNPAIEMTGHLGALQARLGTQGALHMVGSVENVTDARRVLRASDALGPRSVGALEVLGKSRFLRVGLRLADTLREALAGLMAAFVAACGLIWNHLLRRLRKRVKAAA